MLLIVFLGLIAKLTFVSGACDLGPPTLHDFDYSRFSGPRLWYFLKHRHHDTEKNFDCIRGTFAAPEGNRSLATGYAHDKSEHAHKTFHGYITNWNSTGYFEVSASPAMWSGLFRVIAIDYDRYYIYSHCRHGTNELSLYVAYRSPHPDQETVNEVHRVMQTRNVDTSQLVDWSADHCPQTESSAASGSST